MIMKLLLSTILTIVMTSITIAQSVSKYKLVKSACMDYLDGFYQGDTTKIIRSIKPTLNKLGYWKDKDAKTFKNAGYMTFNQAKNYAKGVLEKKNFPKADAPKKVEILDIMNTIASAKVIAWWGVDYILLSKDGDKWMIEQVLWQGPLEK